MRQQRWNEASDAFQQALARVHKHPLARLGLAMLSGEASRAASDAAVSSLEGSTAYAIVRVAAGDHVEAARQIDQALAAAPPGNAGWLLPIEPLLNVPAAPGAWSPVLSRLRTRAA
jgi:hypothetical protein